MDKDGNTLIKAKPRPGVKGINRVLVTGGAGFTVENNTSSITSWRGGNLRMCLEEQFFTGAKENIRTHVNDAQLRDHPPRHRRRSSSSRSTRSTTWRAPRPRPLPVQPGEDDQDERHRHDEHARPREARQGALPQASTSDLRGVRRPRCASASTRRRRSTGATSVNPIGERSCYDEGKRCAETLAFDYKRRTASDIRVARIFNTYGPRMHLTTAASSPTSSSRPSSPGR